MKVILVGTSITSFVEGCCCYYLKVDRLVFSLHHHGIQSIAAIDELDDLVGAVPNGVVILLDQVLEGLDQASLHVPRFCRLYCRVDKTFPTSHRVEKELCRGQAGVKTVQDETLGSWQPRNMVGNQSKWHIQISGDC